MRARAACSALLRGEFGALGRIARDGISNTRASKGKRKDRQPRGEDKAREGEGGGGQSPGEKKEEEEEGKREKRKRKGGREREP